MCVYHLIKSPKVGKRQVFFTHTSFVQKMLHNQFADHLRVILKVCRYSIKYVTKLYAVLIVFSFIKEYH